MRPKVYIHICPMKKVLIDILIGFAVFLVGVGITKLFWIATDQPISTKAAIATVDIAANTQNESHKNHKFVQYILDKFDTENDGWTVLEHNTDETKTKADLLLEYEGETMVYNVAVECTWIPVLSSKGLYWATEGEMRNIMTNADNQHDDAKLFLIVGIGGRDDDPDKLYVVPIKFLQQRDLPPAELANYAIDNFGGKLYFDNNMLKFK